MKREFLQLCQNYDSTKHCFAGWFASEKLDGMRAYWDGGITTGLLAADVPWANVEKHARFKDEVRATGLWTRYGQVIRAPQEWTNRLPPIPLDGELWMGRGTFQAVVSITKRHDAPIGLWNQVQYAVFDAPDYNQVFATGRINNPPNYVKTFIGIEDWCETRRLQLDWPKHEGAQFISIYPWLQEFFAELPDSPVKVVEQIQLPRQNDRAKDALDTLFESICAGGGEGMIVRNPLSRWLPERHHNILKVKPFNDMEVKVVGFTFGRATDRGSRLLGKMGALRCQMIDDPSKEFDVSGFTDEERELAQGIAGIDTRDFAKEHPGELAPAVMELKAFKHGDIITIKYRELTQDGLPKEARYWRKYG